jgi:hypothetical protein
MMYIFERYLDDMTNLTYVLVSLYEILKLWNTDTCLEDDMVGVMKDLNHNSVNVPLKLFYSYVLSM